MNGSWKPAAIGLILGIVLGVGASVLAFRHGPMRSPEERAARMVEKLTRKLELNQTQERQLRAILESRREEMRKIRREIKDSIRGVLTPEQAVKFEEIERKREMRKFKPDEPRDE